MGDAGTRLPDVIIHHILSYLTPKEAAWARLLSKAWLAAWQSFPNLCFDEPHFYKELNPFLSDDEKLALQRRRKMFVEFVNKVLLNYRDGKNGICELKLRMRIRSQSAHLIANWIKIALENGLKKLEICTYESRYTLPPFVLEAGSLKDLDLKWCKIEREVSEGGIMCSNLQRLALKFVDLSDEMFHKIISNSPLIEDLEIFLCKGLKNIKVTNLEKLRKLYVRYDRVGKRGIQRIEVEAPNMEFFKCEQNLGYVEKNPRVLNVFPCQNLKCLVLAGAGVGDLFFVDLATNFPHLEELIISKCMALQRLKFASNSLRLLKMECNYNVNELQVDAPKIVRFEYQGNIIASVLLASASVNWESKILISSPETIDNSWFFRLKGFLTSLISSKIFLKIKTTATVTFNVDQIRDGGPLYGLYPGPEIENLSLHLTTSDPAAFSALVDGCFWVCRPQIIQQWWFYDATINFTRFLHEMLVESRNQDHLNCQDTKFWLKDLKEVKVSSLKRIGKAGWQPELLDWSKDWSKGTGTEWQPELLDWKALLKSDFNCGLRRLIHFSLEW